MRISCNFLPCNNSPISFKSKSSVVKDADWVCRSVNANFPAISTTWLNFNLDTHKKMHFISRIGEDIQKARNKNCSELVPFKFFKNMLNQVKQNKAGNCFEKATIAELILKINGVNNCNRINLVTDNGKRNLNHCVLLVNFDKQNYYPYQSALNFNSALLQKGGVVTSVSTAAQQYYAVRNISWETTETWDIGLDANFLNSRLYFAFDYYKKNTRDMLIALEIPKFIGYDNPFVNTGKMQTKGYD